MPSAATSPAVATGVTGVYPCPFGFALNVALRRTERLVPVVADSAALLASVADALALVRDSGGFEAMTLRLPTTEIRLVFERVPDISRATRRIQALAGDLLARGMDDLPQPEPALGFRAALELRTLRAHSLSVHLYVEGTSSTHERLLGRLVERLQPAFANLVEVKGRAETRFILRRRVLARCRVNVARLLSRLPGRAEHDPSRDNQAVSQALSWLDAAQTEPVLASAQNELVLGSVARMARALGADAAQVTAEAHCHAARFGVVTPLAAFALDGNDLAGVLDLPLGLDPRKRRRDPDADLAQCLMRGDSIEDIGFSATCLGLAAHLATVGAAISLALGNAALGHIDLERTVVTPPHQSALHVHLDAEQTLVTRGIPSRTSPPERESRAMAPPAAPSDRRSSLPAETTPAVPRPSRRFREDSGVHLARHRRSLPPLRRGPCPPERG